MSGRNVVVVVLGAEVQDRGAEQAPLHARLDLQAAGRRARAPRTPAMLPPWSSSPPSAFGKARCTAPCVDEQLQLPEHALAVLGHRLALDALQLGAGGELAGGDADVGPGAEQLPAELLDVDTRRRRLVGRGRGGDRRGDLVARGLRGHGRRVACPRSSGCCGMPCQPSSVLVLRVRRSGSFHGRTGCRRGGNEASARLQTARGTPREGLSRPYKGAVVAHWQSPQADAAASARWHAAQSRKKAVAPRVQSRMSTTDRQTRC